MICFICISVSFCRLFRPSLPAVYPGRLFLPFFPAVPSRRSSRLYLPAASAISFRRLPRPILFYYRAGFSPAYRRPFSFITKSQCCQPEPQSDPFKTGGNLNPPGYPPSLSTVPSSFSASFRNPPPAYNTFALCAGIPKYVLTEYLYVP